MLIIEGMMSVKRFNFIAAAAPVLAQQVARAIPYFLSATTSRARSHGETR